MSNKPKLKSRRGAPRRKSAPRVVAARSTRVSRRGERVHTVRPPTDDCDARAVRLDLPAIPETAAGEIYVLCVSLHGATPPPFRLLEVPSAMTLDRLHKVLQRAFGWCGFGPHSFVTLYGEFFSLTGPTSRAAGRIGEPRDESGVTLVQAAGEEGLGIVYLYGYRDEWQLDIRVEKILPAAASVAYPRCTRGQGEDIPGERYCCVWAFNAERLPIALDTCFDPEDLTDDLADLATAIVPGPTRDHHPARRPARHAKLAVMTDTDSNPEDEYADDEYADHDAEDRDQPSVSTEIPADAPEADVIEQRQEVPNDQNADEPWWDEGREQDQDEITYDEGE